MNEYSLAKVQMFIIVPFQTGVRLNIYLLFHLYFFLISAIQNRTTNGQLTNNYRRTNEDILIHLALL